MTLESLKGAHMMEKLGKGFYGKVNLQSTKGKDKTFLMNYQMKMY